METIEINSIEGFDESIEIIIDGKSDTSFSSFHAKTYRVNQIAIKSEDSFDQTILIDNLSKLTVNGEKFTSIKEAVAAINALANFNSGGGNSSGTSKPVAWGSIEGDLDEQTDLAEKLNDLRKEFENINVSSAGFIPDWNNVISQRQSSYVAPKTGWVIILGSGRNDEDIIGEIHINGFSIFHTSSSEFIHTFPVSEGDVIELQGVIWWIPNDPDYLANSPVIYFIPAKPVRITGEVSELVEIEQVNGLSTILQQLNNDILNSHVDLSNYYDRQQTDALLTKKLGTDTKHNDLAGRDDEDSHQIAAISGLEEELAKKVEDVPDSEIFPTNKTDKGFGFAMLGQDNKLYFGSVYNKGIWRLDDDGTVVQTNKTNGDFQCAALGPDNKLYFGSKYDKGIWYLDDDGTVVQTNKTNGDFRCASLGPDNKLYFGSDNAGIWYLDDDGQVKQTNKVNGNFRCASIGQDNRLYFAGGGIWYLDDDGTVKQTNQTSGGFQCAALGQNNKLYFAGDLGGGNGSPIYYLDNDGLIKIANDGYNSIQCASLGQDNKLYFAGKGIWYLDDDGTVKQTNQTSWWFQCAALGPDNKLYFGSSSDNGIWYLDDDGQFKQTNKTDGFFYCIALGQDNKLYFGSGNDNGIWYLYSPVLFRQDGQWKELNHNLLPGRNKKDAHSISAISGLEKKLEELSNIEHNDLEGRDDEDSHPIVAITGLEERLKQLQTLVETLEVSCVPAISTDKIFPQWDWGTGGTSITTPYTAPSNGWLQWYYDIPASQSITVKVNAVTVFSTGTSTSTAARPSFAVFPVRSGDVIDIVQGSTTHLTAAFFAVPDIIEGTAECTVISAPDDAEKNMVRTAEYVELEKKINELRLEYEDLNLLQTSKLNKGAEDGIVKMILNNDLVNAEHNYLDGRDEADCHTISSITGLIEKLSELDGKANELWSIADLKLNKGTNDDTARIVLNGVPADPQTQIEKILVNNPAGLGMGAGSGLGTNLTSDLLNLLLNDPTNLNKGVKTKLYVSVENRPAGTTSISILNKASGGFGVNVWAYFDASDNSNPVRIGYYNNAWYMVGNTGIPNDTYYLHKVYWIDSSQQFIQKKSWDAESMNVDMKLLGIENDSFRTVMLSDLIAKRFRADGDSTSSPGLTLNLLNGLSINIQGGVVKINSTKTVNMDIRRSGLYDNGSGHGQAADGYSLAANGTYTFATLTTSQLSSAATTDIYLRDNTNNVLYLLHYWISANGVRTTIWGEVIS